MHLCSVRRASARLGALTLSAALALGLLGGPAQADPTPSSTSASTWLSGELVDALLPGPFSPVDVGLSMDAAFAALVTGDDATATRIRDAVEPLVADFVGYSYDGTDYRIANATAKALVLAQRTGADATDFGGLDLVARTEALVDGSGRLRDQPPPDSANIIGQAFAVEGLTRAGSPQAPAALAYLIGQQCGPGFFQLPLTAGACALDAGADTDATTLALAARAGQRDPAASGAITRAVAWLATRQDDGFYGGGVFTEGPNTNSTGLAAAALGSVCQVDAANRAADAVRSLQVGPAPADTPLGGETGAIAYDAAAFSAGAAEGIDDGLRDQWRRATTQAATGLVWDETAPATVTLAGPTAPVAPGSTQELVITGSAAGETVCLTAPSGVRRLLGTGAPLTVPVTAPATGSATWSATTGPGAAVATLAVTAPGAPPVPAPTPPPPPPPAQAATNRVRVELASRTVAVGRKVRITLRGLTTGQRITIRFRGTVVGTRVQGARSERMLTFRVTGAIARRGIGTLRIRTRPSAPASGKQVLTKTIRIVG